MIARISIRKKILLTFLFFFLISLAVSGSGYYRYFVLNKKLRLVESKYSLLNKVLEARRYEKNFFITLDGKHIQDAIEYARESRKSLGDLLDTYGTYVQTKNIRAQVDNLISYEQTLSLLYSRYIQDRAGQPAANTDTEPFKGLQAKVRSLGREVTEALEGGLMQERQHIQELVRQSRWHFASFLGLIVIIALVFFLLLIINVDRPLKVIEKAINKIANGDYQNIPEIRTGDEFERLVDSLNSMLRELGRRSEQLVQSEKMVALGTLTSGVAHELNNPLNNISTSLQIILEELEDGDLDFQRELLKESEDQVGRAQEIVKALLEFSRETEFTLSRERFSSLVENTLKLIQGDVPKNVGIKVEVPESIEADLDARRIQQVLLNLCINAIQAMERDGGELTIRAREGEDGLGFLFEVADTGQGIPETEISKIFDPFYSSKDMGKGSGLGLSISKGIVENHGGWISVSSSLGQGTVFTVYLPQSSRAGASRS